MTLFWLQNALGLWTGSARTCQPLCGGATHEASQASSRRHFPSKNWCDKSPGDISLALTRIPRWIRATRPAWSTNCQCWLVTPHMPCVHKHYWSALIFLTPGCSSRTWYSQTAVDIAAAFQDYGLRSTFRSAHQRGLHKLCYRWLRGNYEVRNTRPRSELIRCTTPERPQAVTCLEITFRTRGLTFWCSCSKWPNTWQMQLHIHTTHKTCATT